MNLKNKYREILKNIFSQFSTPMEIWAYGSRVDGTAHDGSDLDLVILTPGNKKLPIELLTEIKEKIKESNIPVLVQIFDWARLPKSFHDSISKNHETLYSSINLSFNEPETDYQIKT